MAYYFFLGACPLPIPPAALNVETPTHNYTVNLINDGEVNILKGNGLKEISFEVLLPMQTNYPFANYSILGLIETNRFTAGEYLRIFNDMLKNKKPFRFIVVRTSPKGRMDYDTILCTMEKCDKKEDAEELGFDVMCSITLKEYKPYGTKRVKIENAPSGKPGIKTATVEKTRDTTGKTPSQTVQTSNSNTIVSAAKKNGDDLVDLAYKKNISIPSDGSVSSVSNSLNIENVDLDKYTKPTFDGTDSSGNVLIGGGGTTPIKSLGDTILLGS